MSEPLSEERLDDLRRTPRQADVTDVEDLVSEVDRLRDGLKKIEARGRLHHKEGRECSRMARDILDGCQVEYDEE